MGPLLMRSKSTSSASVAFNGAVSYRLMAASLPGAASAAGVIRGKKNPGTPKAMA
jgi:hypothetical protein